MRNSRYPEDLTPVVFGLFLIVLLLTFSVPGAGAVRPGTPAAVHPSTVHLASVYHGNLYVNVSGPLGFADIGSRVSAQYRFLVSDFTSGGGGNQLRIPSTIVLLPARQGPLHFYLPSGNLTVNSSSTPTGTINGSVRLTSSVTFNTTPVAALTSQGFAVMASWLRCEFQVFFQWQWKLLRSDGSATDGPWSNWSKLVPTQTAWIQNSPPRDVAAGAPYLVCLGGPIATRTFSVHLSTSAPVVSFSGPAVTVPPGFVGVYCFNTTMPSDITPQAAIIHVWEYSTLTFLLFQLPVQIHNASWTGATGSGSPPALAYPAWLLPVAAVLVVMALVVGVAFYARSRRA